MEKTETPGVTGCAVLMLSGCRFVRCAVVMLTATLLSCCPLRCCRVVRCAVPRVYNQTTGIPSAIL
jgi:hypothetical protein